MTISEMKLEVKPMMVTRETNCMARMAVQVTPRAPREGGECILRVLGVTMERRGRDEPAVRSGRRLE